MKEKINQKGFIQIPILIAIIVSVLVLGGGYFGIKKYQNYQTEKIEKEKLVQEAQQQKDSELDSLKQEIEALKNQKPQVIVQSPAKAPNLMTIIQEWKPRVAYIECQWAYSDTGRVYRVASGSGFLWRGVQIGRGTVETNLHVILDDNGYSPTECVIKFSGESDIHVYKTDRPWTAPDRKDWGPFSHDVRGYDSGSIMFANPSNSVMAILNSSFNSCKTLNQKAAIGESVVILGYPGIGGNNDITATEGIISSYDGDYYITSAKIEHGNSGGIAILIKDNCFLGIPSYAEAGEIESMGRILDGSKVIFY